MYRKNLNGSDLQFPQDSKISFEEITHTYTVEGVGEMTPVSSVIGKFFKPFDTKQWSLRKSNYDEMAAAKLREEWESKGCVASQAGTHLHKQIEDFINGKETPELTCDIDYYGNFISFKKTVDISREWSFFKNFDSQTAYTPFRTEWCVYDTDARMAGTIDLICSREDGTYEIYDWKRSNKINPSEINKWQSGIHGLETLTDTAYSHYCLQQNLYRYILEKNYGIKVSRMNLVVLHPDYEDYRIVNIPMLDRYVAIVVDYITKQQ